MSTADRPKEPGLQAPPRTPAPSRPESRITPAQSTVAGTPLREIEPYRPPAGEEAGRERKSTKQGLSLIIPALNEEDAIRQTIAAARGVFREHDIEAEIVVVDDGSTDRTAELAALDGATVVQCLSNRGYGNALRAGILAARHQTIAICDADGTYPIDRLPDLLEEHRRGYDLVIGCRTGRYFHGSLVKRIARICFHRLCESATGTKIPDGNSGLRVFSREAILPYLPMMCSGFSFTTSQTLCFLSQNRDVSYVPVAYADRIGKSKVRHLADSLRTAQYIVQFYTIFNPVKLFTTLAALPTLAGLLCLAVALPMLVADAELAWLPTLIGSSSIGLALGIFSMGLATWGISRQQWRYSESGPRPGPDR